MKVNSIEKKDISFNGFYNSKALKNILKFAENNGALFASVTSLALSATARPAAIFAAPKTDNENKKIACAKSIVSTLLDFGITFAISLPIVRAVGKINKNPEKFLKSETIKNLKEDAESLNKSKAYLLANQMFKLGAGIIVALPKAVLNVLGIPFILEAFPQNNNQVTDDKNNITFKGKKSEDKIAALIAQTIDNSVLQKFSKKHQDSNFPMNINAIKDTTSTLIFSAGVYKEKNIDKNRKGALIYNSLISTAISIPLSYLADSLTGKFEKNFVENLKQANKKDANLQKYIDGFKIAKPIFIMGLMYYILTPLISTFLAERVDKKFPIKNKSDMK